MLDVERRVDIDSRRQQFVDIHVPFRMPAARRVCVGQFIDQHQPRLPFQNRIQIHFVQDAPAIADVDWRNFLQPFRQRGGFSPSMRLHHTHNDIHALLLAGARGGQHFEGLPDAGRGAEKDLQAASPGTLRLFQERVRRGSSVIHWSDWSFPRRRAPD